MKQFSLLLVTLFVFIGTSNALGIKASGLVPDGTTLPGACAVGVNDLFFLTTPGSVGLYQCSSTDTWTPVSSAVLPEGTAFPPTCAPSSVLIRTDQSAGTNVYICDNANTFHAVGGSGTFTYPTAGIPVSSGTAWGTSVAAPTGAIVGTTDTQTLTNKTVDGVSPTTLAFLDATSSVQTQLNGKQASGSYLTSQTYPSAGLGVSTGTAWTTSIAAPVGAIVGTTDTQTLTNKTVDGVIPATFGFLDATSSIQTQLNGKQASGSYLTSQAYPAIGIGVSTGSAWGTSITAPTGAIVGTTDTQTLTNKTIDGVSPATFAFLDPTSSIQTQLNGKQPSGSYLTSQTYPGVGIPVSTGSAWTTSITAPTGAIVGTTDTQTLTNKTIAASEITGLSTASSLATTGQNFNAGSFTYDFSGAAHTLPALKGLTASKPGTCIIGEEYFATDATAGQNMYYCTGANTWSQQLSGGSMTYPSGSGIPIVVSGTSWGTTVAAPAGTIVGTTDTQTLTNKTIASTEITGLPTFPTGAIVGTTDTQTLTNKTIDGVSSATMAFVDPTSSIQTQLNGKQASGSYLTSQAYPAAGIAVSTGSAWTTSLTAPTGAIVGTTDTQTLTNKTIAASQLSAGTVASTVTIGTGGSLITSGTGAITATKFTDFPDKKYIPGANCNNATAGAGWSLPTSGAPTVACHTGTNIQDGYLQFADAQSAQFSLLIPDDWDSASSLDAKVFFTDVSTSGTVILQAATSCTSIAGGAVDDAAFNTAQSFGTITLATTASVGWVASLTGLTKTGCSAGNFLHIKISRTTDTATGAANISGAQLTIRRTF